MPPVPLRGERAISVLLLCVMMAWGLNISAVKALTGVMDVAWVSAIRLVAATVTLTLCLWLRDRRLPRLDAREWRLLAGAAVLCIYGNQLLFAQGMRMASASNASLVMALLPVLALVAGACVLGERVAARAWAGVCLGFAGVGAVVLGAPTRSVGVPGLGELVILAGLVSFVAGGLLIQRGLQRLDGLVVGWAIALAGTPLLCLHALLAGGWQQALGAFDTGWVWACTLYSGVIGTALSNVGWYHALGRVGQSRASPYLYWLAVFGVVFSALALSEPLSGWHALGLALVVAGVRLAAEPKRPR